MWALVKNNSLVSVYNHPISVVIDDIRHSSAIFTLWSKSERKAIGIYDYVEVGAKPDNRFYRQGSSSTSINNSTGTVTITFAKIEKSLTDVKNTLINQAKSRANSILEKTDWQVIAKAERNRTIDSDVATYRAAVVTAYGEIKTLINNQDTIVKVEALYNAPLDDEGNPRRDGGGNVISKHDIDKWPDALT